MEDSKFQTGDRIRATVTVGAEEVNDAVGTIIDIDFHDYAVRFDEYIGGHTCDGLCEDGYGWWVYEEHMIVLNNPLPDIDIPSEIDLI